MFEDKSLWGLKHQGAESRIKWGTYCGQSVVVKERFVKMYRNPVLDERLTKERVRAEVRAFMKIKDKCTEVGQLMPTILLVTDRDIIMTRLEEAKTACQVIREAREGDLDISSLFTGIGKLIGQIHGDCGVIHGDLTTSNILVDSEKRLVPIDFGLSSIGTSTEDRAVDLYVLQRALESTHVEESSFKLVLDAYAQAVGAGPAPGVLTKLDEVRSRGRKRLMIG